MRVINVSVAAGWMCQCFLCTFAIGSNALRRRGFTSKTQSFLCNIFRVLLVQQSWHIFFSSALMSEVVLACVKLGVNAIAWGLPLEDLGLLLRLLAHQARCVVATCITLTNVFCTILNE